METRLELNDKEIKQAIKYYIENVLNKKVIQSQLFDVPEISLSHSEDDRASGVFHYYAYIEVENSSE